jgi:hypothetical protein
VENHSLGTILLMARHQDSPAAANNRGSKTRVARPGRRARNPQPMEPTSWTSAAQGRSWLPNTLSRAPRMTPGAPHPYYMKNYMKRMGEERSTAARKLMQNAKIRMPALVGQAFSLAIRHVESFLRSLRGLTCQPPSRNNRPSSHPLSNRARGPAAARRWYSTRPSTLFELPPAGLSRIPARKDRYLGQSGSCRVPLGSQRVCRKAEYLPDSVANINSPYGGRRPLRPRSRRALVRIPPAVPARFPPR